MSTERQTFSQIATVTVPAATETDLLSDATGFDVRKVDSLCVALSNTGSHDVDTLTIYESPGGTTFLALGQNFGPLPAGSTRLIEMQAFTGARARLTATSASGTTVAVEARGGEKA